MNAVHAKLLFLFLLLIVVKSDRDPKCIDLSTNYNKINLKDATQISNSIKHLEEKYFKSIPKIYFLILMKNCDKTQQVINNLQHFKIIEDEEKSEGKIEFLCLCGINEKELLIQLINDSNVLNEIEVDEKSRLLLDLKKHELNSIQPCINNFNFLVEKTASFLSLKNKMKNKFSDEQINKNQAQVQKQYNLELAQTNLKLSDAALFSPGENMSEEEREKMRNIRFIRTLWVSSIVFSLTIFCFMIIKSSVDCATNSRNSINKWKENQANDITAQIQRLNLLKNSGTTYDSN